MSRLYLGLFIILASLSPLFALDLATNKISDDSALRLKLRDNWFYDTPANVLARGAVMEQLPTGERVEVKAVDGRTEIMVILARELVRGRLETDLSGSQPRRPTGRFPGWAQGSWMLTRRKDTGAGVQIRIFLRSDQFAYIDLRPLSSDKSKMDVVLYGGILAKDIPIAVPFERLYTMKLNDILRLAENKFPRCYFDPDPVLYRDSRRFVTQVRKGLEGLRYADDGAIDENNNFVFIETLAKQTSERPGVNCSGFLKWLIDGCLRPVTGKRLSIEPLKMPFGDRGSSFTDRWENYIWIPPDEENNFEGKYVLQDVSLSKRLDPYFGLDWIRNLAAEANGTLRSNAHRALEEFEVRSDMFSLIENRSSVIYDYPGFIHGAGYGIEGLWPLLYTLAIDNPFSFYLAAVNTELGQPVTPENPRGAPRLRQYYHVAALVPYFDEYGDFRIAVFESAAESSFSGFRGRYPGHYVNLARIPVPLRFEP